MVVYLDVMAEIKDNQIVTDVYYKPMDTHQYSDWTSCHPNFVCLTP